MTEPAEPQRQRIRAEIAKLRALTSRVVEMTAYGGAISEPDPVAIAAVAVAEALADAIDALARRLTERELYTDAAIRKDTDRIADIISATLARRST